MMRIGPVAPLGKGYVDKPYTNCKWCETKLDPNQHMMYYCDTACFHKQNITGGIIQTVYVPEEEEE